jgi:voltage-gated potassium channel
VVRRSCCSHGSSASHGCCSLWGVVTLTTVGYGDVVPITHAGRFAGIAIMFTGAGVLGVLAKRVTG